MPRRKSGSLLPIEVAILGTLERLAREGQMEPYGFAIALRMGRRAEALRLKNHGTLYRALERLDSAGLVISRREDPLVAEQENRPVRRLYTLTPAGLRALTKARAVARAEARLLKERMSES